MTASTVTVAQMCDAIHSTVGAVLVASGDLVKALNYNQLEEGMADRPTLQIYPQRGGPVSGQSGTQKLTLDSDPYILEQVTIFMDLYAARRSNLNEDMEAVVDGLDAINANLKTQQCPNPFGLTGISTFQWSWERVIFDYDSPEEKYPGIRYTLILETF